MISDQKLSDMIMDPYISIFKGFYTNKLSNGTLPDRSRLKVCAQEVKHDILNGHILSRSS